jgi:hypothetical protein
MQVMSIQRRRQDTGAHECSVRASISFPEEQYSVLEQIAAEHRVSLAWVVRDAVDVYLKARWPLLEQDENVEKKKSDVRQRE